MPGCVVRSLTLVVVNTFSILLTNIVFLPADLEDLKISLESERNRLQSQLRDVEKDQLGAEHQIETIKQEIQRCQAANLQQQAEEKELQSKYMNEVEERERSHQEVHQLRKQVNKYIQ